MKRTQIYLEGEQATEVARRARRKGVTSSHVIREAINDYLAQPEDETDRLARFRAALDEAFGVAPDLPSGADYVDELRRTDERRQSELEHRWRR
jgi:Arc/MetJ-type ribon-helix-helix transcriptional regulator